MPTLTPAAETYAIVLSRPFLKKDFNYDGTNRIFPSVTLTKQTKTLSNYEPDEPDSNRISAPPLPPCNPLKQSTNFKCSGLLPNPEPKSEPEVQ
jgi:hypothetical protein